MHTLTIVLRFIHVVGGAFWFGSAIMMGFFISPTIAATAEAGQKFMGYLVNKARIHNVIAISAILTVLAGGGLYWIDSGGFTSAWTRSGAGSVFGIGGFFGIIGLIFGLLVGVGLYFLAHKLFGGAHAAFAAKLGVSPDAAIVDVPILLGPVIGAVWGILVEVDDSVGSDSGKGKAQAKKPGKTRP